MAMIVVMLPAFLLGVYERNGQPLEVALRNIVRVSFLRPKARPYRTNNFYAVLERQDKLDREAYRIVHGKSKTVPRRAPRAPGAPFKDKGNG